MRWALVLLALACGLGLLVLPAGAAPSASGSVSIVVDESVAPGDGSTATPPAGVGSDEPVGTSDAVSVSPPASVPGTESVSVSDDVSVVPPVSIVVDESVSPSDAPAVVPPASVSAAESATVTDDVSVGALTVAPGPPTSVVAAAGDGSAAVSWLPPVTNGGGSIGGYTVTPHDVTAGSDGTPVGVGGTSASVTGLTNGDAYTFTVTASNSAGPGLPSAPSSSVTPQAGSAPPAASAGNAASGGTVTAGDGNSATAPLGAAVTTPTGGTITIVTAPPSGSPPAGYQFAGQEVDISAPPASAAAPLSLSFTVDGSVIGTASPSHLQVFRDAVPVADCTGSSGNAAPDPCVASRTPTRDGGVTIVVLSSHASSWNFGFATAPVVSAGGPYTVDEGASFTLHGSASNAAGLAMTFSWDLGGGATATGATPTIVAGDGPATTTATLTVCETGGACASDKTTIHVNNVAPTAKILAPADGSVFRVRTHVALSGSFTDPGIADTHKAVWTVGAATIPATVAEHGGSGTAAATWTPTAAGLYPLSLTVTDKDGGTTTVSGGTLVVFDPAAGSVSGAGSLVDPGHDLVLFDFEARYRDHDSDPSGHVELHAPHLTLFATHLDWLVVTSPSFVLQGDGRVLDRRGSYRFRLSGVTGHPDQLRVQIWAPGGSLVYDSTQRPLRFGDIRISRS